MFFGVYHYSDASFTISRPSTHNLGLVGHWTFDGGKVVNGVALDSAGTNNGNLKGIATSTFYSYGKIGQGFNFDGLNDYVSVGTMGSLGSTFANGNTIALWFKSSVTGTIMHPTGTLNTGTKTAIVYRINSGQAGTLNAGYIGFYFRGENGDETDEINGGVESNTGITDGKWHHLVFSATPSANTMNIYVDGVAKTVDYSHQETTSVMANFEFPLTIGARNNRGTIENFTTGNLDDVRVYDRALSAADIAELYNYTDAPVVTTNTATNIAQTSATLNATVNNNGLTTIAWFEYGLTTAYGNTTPTQTVSDLGNIAVSSAISSLDANTVYYYRAVAANSAGTTNGTEQTFTTAASLPALAASAPKTLSPITIDGALTESVWNLTESINRTISGANNNTTTFQALWDDNYLYVAYKVLDSNLINDSANEYQDDSVELYLDPDNSKSTTYDTNDRQFTKGYNDTALTAPQNGTGILHNTTNITGGYTVELAIPWTNLNAIAAANQIIGFDLQQNDDDTGGDTQSALGWNSTTGTNYNNTSAFGTLTLSSQTVGTSGGFFSSSSSSVTSTDTTSPTISISSPTTNTTYSTSASTIDVSGAASDNIGISSITCTNNGSSCSAVSGTTSWSISSIPLTIGTNTIIVTARDSSNNSSTDTLTVTRTTTTTSNQWQQVAKRTQAQKTAGLAGGEGMQMIFSITYAPSDPSIVYFVTDTQGVWKSTDGGTSWQRKSGEYPTSGGISIVVDPTNENIVYTAGSVHSFNDTDTSVTVEGIIRTADGGDTWTLVKPAHFHRSAGFGGNHIDFAGTNIYAAPSTGGILKSTNGTTWNLLNKSGGGYVLDTLKLYNIKAHPTNNTILFASATNGLHKIVDVNGSATVTKIGTGLPAGAVYQVQIDKNNPNIMYVAAGKYGVYRSTDGGLNFSPRNNGLSSPRSSGGSARWLAMAPTNSNRLFVTFQNIFGKHLYYTNDSGANWTQTSTMDEQNADGWVAGSLYGYTTNLDGINNASAPIAFHPTNQDTALVNGLASRVKKTTDGGVTWKYSNTGYTGSVIGNRSVVTSIGWDATNANRAVYSHSDIGSLITEDNEDTFKYIATVSWNGRKATPAVAMQGSIIVEAVGQTNNNDQFHALAVSRNSGSDWTILESATGDFVFISFHPQNSNIVYAGKYRFNNIGTSNTYLTHARDVKGIFKGNGDIVYSYSGNTVYKSTDGGATWTTPYPSLNLPAGSYVRMIAINSTNQNRIYVAASFQGVYIITDTVANGGTVQIKNDANGIAKDANNRIYIESVATDPNDENVVYAGATNTGWSGPANGVFRSTDRGATWVNINGNLGSNLNTLTLTVNPFNSYVYLSSFAGTWKLPPPGTVSISDTTPPAVSIASPTSASTYSTTASTVALSGTASDNVGVTSVTWNNSANSTGGTASGTASWSIANISLISGINNITVTVRDAKGNISTDTLSVTRTTTTSSSSSSVQSSSSSISLPTLTTSAKKTLSAITLDGNLSESVWNLTESITRTISGVNNNTATFSALWDNTYLYIAYKVLDSNLRNDSTYPWADDSVELYLDPNNSKSTTYDANDRQFVKGWNDATLAALQNGTGVLHNTANIAGGYIIELAIPWSNLGLTPSANMTIGFDLQQNDDDTGGDVQSAKGWNSTTGANYKNTSAFGNLTLSSQTVGTAQSSSSSAASQSSSAQSSVSSPSSSSQSSSVSSTKFITGDRVITTDTLNVRSSASLTGTALGAQSLNQAGTIVSGPVSSGGYNWYDVNYDNAPDGWSVENYLEKVVQSSSSSQPASSSSSAGEAGSSSSSSSYVTQTFQSSTGNIGGSGGGGGGGGSGIYIPPVSYESTLKTIASSTKEKALTSSSTPIVSVIGASFSSNGIIYSPQAIFTQDLKIGSRSAQVKTLQEKLAKDKTLYPEGLTTGYYGSLTQAAVKRFQKKHNLAATGSIDLKTRAKLNEIYGQTSAARPPDGQGQASSPQASSTTSPKSPYSSLTETQRQELIKQLQETLKKLLLQLIELLKKQTGR